MNLLVSYTKKLSLILLLVFLASSCKKKENNTEPVVEVFSPNYEQSFLLPDNINVSFKVTHDKPIEYIRVSFVDYNMIPVSSQEFIYPENNSYEGNINFIMNALPVTNELLQHYVNITVSDFSQINQTYLDVDLANRELKYKGSIILAKSGIDLLSISSYNINNQPLYTSEISGNYTDSDISTYDNKLFVITNIPDKVNAFDTEDGELLWTKDPQLPYPEFNRVTSEDNVVYLSTGIGRVIGLNSYEGMQIFTTSVLKDSIPVNICNTTDFLFSDIKLRNSYSKVWVSYYKQTGSKYQVFPVNLETVDIYSFKNENRVLVFCNDNSLGQVCMFNIEHNIIETEITLGNRIQHSCKIDDTNYIISSDNNIFHYNTQSQTSVEIAQTNDVVIDINYNPVNKQLFVAYADKLEIFSYPELHSIAFIESSYLIVGFELMYGY